jgi:hypothetical protein
MAKGTLYFDIKKYLDNSLPIVNNLDTKIEPKISLLGYFYNSL